MLKSSKKLIFAICTLFIFTTSICFAYANNSYLTEAIIANLKNENANLIAEYSINDMILAKNLRDAHITAIVYDVDDVAIDNVEKYYVAFKCNIGDLKGDFSSFTRNQISNMVLFVSSMAYDARCISNYSILDELLGTDNISKIKEEGIGSICYAYLALSCTEEYKLQSAWEREQLLNEILKYNYKTIDEVSTALTSVSVNLADENLNKWKLEMLDVMANMYNSESCTTLNIAHIISAYSLSGLDVETDSRLKTIMDVFYDRINTDSKKNKVWIQDVLHALVCYEKQQHNLDNIYFYKDYNLKMDSNKLNTEIYKYLTAHSDVASHWSKDKFIPMILNSNIPYSYTNEKNLFPNDAVSKGEFISWICRSRHFRRSSKDYLSEKDDSKYKNDINTFIENRIATRFISQQEKTEFISLYFDKGFHPEDIITREEAAFLIHCAYGNINLSHNNTENIKTFIDCKDCNEKYVNSMDFCIEFGFMAGRDGKLLPQGPLTRAEAAVLISR